MPKHTRASARLSAKLALQLADQLNQPPPCHKDSPVAPDSDPSILVNGSAEQDEDPVNQVSKGKRPERKRQITIPVVYEKFSTNKDIATVLETVTFPIAVTPLQLRDTIVDVMAIEDPAGLVYTLTGVAGPSVQKPFTTLIEASNALDEVVEHIRRSRGKTKGLKITNKTPIPKSENVLPSTQNGKGKAKVSQAMKKAQAQCTATQIEIDFIKELQATYGDCSAPACHGATCLPDHRSGKHIRMSYPAMLFWAKEHSLHPTTVTIDRPPNHAWFDLSLVGMSMPSTTVNTHAGPSSSANAGAQELVAKNKDIKNGDSALLPIYIDLDEPVASSSTLTGPKHDWDDIIEIWSSASPGKCDQSEWESGFSTRLPSPSEILSPPIESLFAELDVHHPTYSLPPLTKRFHLYGIRFVNDIVECSVAWFVDELRIPLDAALLIHGAACNFGMVKIEKESRV